MIRKDIKALAAYHVQDADGLIKLDAMENPYALPDTLRAPWSRLISNLNINRYPDAQMHALRQAIAERDGVHGDQVLLGNGSDEIIQMMLMAADQGSCILPQPTFSMYEIISRWLRRPVATIPLDRNFNLSADAFLRVCAHEKVAIAFLACPNNPTGNLWPRETVRKIAGAFQGMLVIDEAYRPFSDETYVDMLATHVIVLRTFSKLGMAGLRIGYALGHADTIAEINKVRLPYNINSPGQASLRFFLDHFDAFEDQISRIRDERQRVLNELTRMNGVTAYPSQTNFLLLRVPDADAAFAGLVQRGILVRNLHGTGGLMKNCLRVTLGLPEENEQFPSSLRAVLP